MYILVVGSGGREHALAWKCAQDKSVSEVFVCPGNAGTALENKVSNVAINVDDFTAVKDFCVEKNIALVIVGPEQLFWSNNYKSNILFNTKIFNCCKVININSDIRYFIF